MVIWIKCQKNGYGDSGYHCEYCGVEMKAEENAFVHGDTVCHPRCFIRFVRKVMRIQPTYGGKSVFDFIKKVKECDTQR